MIRHLLNAKDYSCIQEIADRVRNDNQGVKWYQIKTKSLWKKHLNKK